MDKADVLKWLESFKLSRQTDLRRNLEAALSDGVVVAELIEQRFPKLCKSGAFTASGKVAQKVLNWTNLNRVFTRLGCPRSTEELGAFAERQPGAIVNFLGILRYKLAAYEPIYHARTTPGKSEREAQRKAQNRLAQPKHCVETTLVSGEGRLVPEEPVHPQSQLQLRSHEKRRSVSSSSASMYSAKKTSSTAQKSSTSTSSTSSGGSSRGSSQRNTSAMRSPVLPSKSAAKNNSKGTLSATKVPKTQMDTLFSDLSRKLDVK